MKNFAPIMLVILICPSAIAQSFVFADEHPFKDGSDEGRIEIEMKETNLKRGEMVRLQYTFYVTNSSYSVYNWQFNRLLSLPGQLAIYDSSKRYISDLLCWAGGSRSIVRDEDWTFLSGGSFVGTTLDFRAGLIPCTIYDNSANPLPAGAYYIQLIMYRAFLSPNPHRVLGEPYDFYRNFDRAELCRSNIIQIMIADD